MLLYCLLPEIFGDELASVQLSFLSWWPACFLWLLLRFFSFSLALWGFITTHLIYASFYLFCWICIFLYHLGLPSALKNVKHYLFKSFLLYYLFYPLRTLMACIFIYIYISFLYIIIMFFLLLAWFSNSTFYFFKYFLHVYILCLMNWLLFVLSSTHGNLFQHVLGGLCLWHHYWKPGCLNWGIFLEKDLYCVITDLGLLQLSFRVPNLTLGLLKKP